jgi:RND family efflux transporter MFP subunit
MSENNTTSTQESKRGSASIWLTVVLSIAILGGAAGVTYMIYSSEPQAKRSGAVKETAMLVDVIRAEKGNFRPTITGLGPVEAAKDIVLSPRVSGIVLDIADSFMPGGLITAGTPLVTIDPSDYEIDIRQRQSDLEQARAQLEIEMGRQDVARREFALIDQEISKENQALVLRKPQLASAEASVHAAQAALDQAELQLKRTIINAPFDAQVISRTINRGSQVSPGTELGRLVGIEEYWVIAAVPLAALEQIDFPEGDKAGSPVIIRNRSAWPEGVTRSGRVSRLIGALDETTRLARVVVSVKDPLARKTTGAPRLIVGSIVQAEITGRELTDIIRVDRAYLRQDDTVWLMDDDQLVVQKVEVLFRDRKFAYITEGLSDNDLIVTTNLATIVPGAPLRTESQPGPDVQQSEEAR